MRVFLGFYVYNWYFMLFNTFTKCFIYINCFLFASSVHAIVNVENLRIDPNQNQSGFQGLFSLDVNGNNGNTQNARAALGAHLKWYDQFSTDLLVMDYAYGESSSVKDTDKSFVHYRHVWYVNKRISWEAFAQLQTNEFTRLKLRSLVGGGARLNLLVDNDNHTAYLGLGVLRSREKLDTPAGTSDEPLDYATRLNLYQVYQYRISEHSRLINMVYYQPDVSEFSDYRLLEQLALKLDINDRMSLKVSLDVAHDSRPPQNIETTDTSYNTGLEYRF